MRAATWHLGLAVRTTWVLPMGVLALATEVAGILGRGRNWVGVWPQATIVVMWPSMFVATIVAATACLSARSRVQAGAEPLLGVAALPRWRVELVAIAPAIGVGVVALGGGVVTVTAMSWASRGPGWLWPGYLAAPLALVLLAAAAGHLVGLLAPSPWAVPVVGAAAFAVAVSLPVFLVLDGAVQLRPSTPSALSISAAGIGAVVVAVLAPGASHRQAHRVAPRRAITAVGVAAVSSLMVAAAAGPVQEARVFDGDPVCGGSAPEVCLWPDSRRWLGDATEVADTMGARARAHGLIVPARIDELGLPGATPESDTTLTSGLGRWDIADSIASSIMAASTRTCPPDPGQGPDEATEYYTALYSLQYWLTVLGDGPMPDGVHTSFESLIDRPLIEALAAGPYADQAAWVTAQLGVLGRAC